MTDVNHNIHKLSSTDLPSSEVQAQAARTLAFLQVIESTVTRVTADTRIAEALVNELDNCVAQIAEMNFEHPLDPEGRASELLQKASDSARRVYATVCHKRDSARADKRLTEDDGVDEAFDRFAQAISAFHDAIEELRDVIETKDALLSPVGEKVYADVDELFADLRSK